MASLDCGKGSDLVVTNNNGVQSLITFDGVTFTLDKYQNLKFYCYGSHTYTTPSGVVGFLSSNNGLYEIGSALNFISGLLIAILVGRLILLLFGK